MTTNDHLNIIRVLQSVYSGKKIFVECFPTDTGAITIPNSNFAVKEVDISKLPESPLPSKGQEGEAERKAKELVAKFRNFAKDDLGREGNFNNSKQCALICVDDEISRIECVWADVAAGEARSCKYTQRHIDFMKQVRTIIVNL